MHTNTALANGSSWGTGNPYLDAVTPWLDPEADNYAETLSLITGLETVLAWLNDDIASFIADTTITGLERRKTLKIIMLLMF